MQETRIPRNLLLEETLWATRRELPTTSEPSTREGFRLRVERSDYRRAEAVIREKRGTPSLGNVRTWIGRGLLSEARDEITAISEMTDELTADLLFEQSRIAYREGNWQETLSITQRLLALPDLPSITRLFVLQTRSLAWFEIGEWTKSLRDCDEIKALGILYPLAQAVFYNAILEVKLIARIYGLNDARYALRKIEEKIARDEYPKNLDTILTWLRLKIDLARIGGDRIGKFGIASWKVAEAMGDTTYEDLAILDLKYSELRTRYASDIEKRLEKAKARTLRVAQLLAELEGSPYCETARTIGRVPMDFRGPEGCMVIACDYENLVLPTLGARVNLVTLDVHPIRPQGRVLELLSHLAHGDVERDDLFKRIWNVSYRSESHDLLLRNLISKARRQIQIPIECVAGAVRLKKTEMIL